MSRLIEKLRYIVQGGDRPIGFRSAMSSTPDQSMLLIAASPLRKIAEAKDILTTVDAVIVSEEEDSSLLNVVKVVGDIPWGVWLEIATEDKVKALREAGGDFFLFEAKTTPLAIVQEQESGRVAKIDPALDDSLVRTFDQLPVDAVLLSLGREEASLTLFQIMQCQRLVNLMHKPLLLGTSASLIKKDIESLWETGVVGIVVEAEGNTRHRLEEYRQIIKTLPPTRRKQSKKVDALLPPLTGSYLEE